MRILSSTFWFAIFVIRALKCEAVIFDIYSSACANGMSITRARAARCAHDVTAHAVTHGMMWAMFSLCANKIGPTFDACGA